MKKSILLFGLILCVGLLMAQNFAQLSLSDTDVSGLEPGDKVYISIEIDTISPGIDALGWTMFFYIDDEVVTWDGTNSFPMLGISYVNPLFPPVIIPPNVSINYFDGTFGWMWGGDANLDGEEFPLTLITLIFTYHGGETPIIWDSQTIFWGGIEPLELTLVNGCVCDFNDVTFHVTSVNGDLEGAEVTVGDESATTNSTGIAVFDLPDGDYTYTVTKYGFADEEGTFTVAGEPVQVEVEMEVCWPVTFHVISNEGAIENFIVIINNDTISSDSLYTLCLATGSYPFTIIAPGYYPHSGILNIDGAPVLLNIILLPILYEVTFFVNCCGEPLEGIMLTIGTTTVVTGANGLAILNLEEGDYTVEINGYIFNFSVPETSFVDADICSEVLFSVSSGGNPVEEASITINNESVVTNALGIAEYCVTPGIYPYIIEKDGYLPKNGVVTVTNEPQNAEVHLECEVTFECWCFGPLEGAVVTCSGKTAISDVNGLALMSLENGEYDYTVFFNEFGEAYGFFDVNGSPVFVWSPFICDNVRETNLNVINIHPNPSPGKFSIENINHTGELTEIFVTDITGRIVYQTITSNLDKTEIDLTDQPKGMYFIRIKAGQMVVNRKVVVQ